MGLALSDAEGKFATPSKVLEVRSADAAIRPILELIAQEAVGRAVIGLPLNMDGTTGPAAKATVAWGRQLASRSAVEVLFVDERLSSFEAEQQLVARKKAGEKLTRGRKKQRLDALAAAGFLQAFLDGRIAAIEV